MVQQQTTVTVEVKRSVGLAYLLWFFFGGLGGHRFYLGRTGTAVAQLILTVLGVATAWLGVGFLLLVPVGIWLLVDLFLIPGMAKTPMVLQATQTTVTTNSSENS